MHFSTNTELPAIPLGVVPLADVSAANKQDAALAKMETLAGPVVAAYSAAIESAAMGALNAGQFLDLNEKAIAPAIDEFTGLALVVYLQTLQNYGGKNVEFSAFDSRIKSLAKSFNVNVGVLSKKLKAIVSDNVRDSLHYVKKRINKTLQEITAAGMTKKQGRDLLQKRLERMGVTPRNRGYIDTIIKAHTGIAYSAAQYDAAMADPGVWGFRYVAMEDELVRINHEKLHGLTKNKNHAIWSSVYPPNGWNCRCKVVPLRRQQPETRLPPHAAELPDEGFRFNPSKQIH